VISDAANVESTASADQGEIARKGPVLSHAQVLPGFECSGDDPSLTEARKIWVLKGVSQKSFGAGWLKRRLVATVEYLERIAATHLRHSMFSGCQAWLPKVPVLNQVVRESKSVRSVCTSATARGQAQPHGSVSG